MARFAEYVSRSVRLALLFAAASLSVSQSPSVSSHEYSTGGCCDERYIDCTAWQSHPNPICRHAHDCVSVDATCAFTGCFGCPHGCWPHESACTDFDMDGIANNFESEDCPSCQYDPDPDDDTNPLLDLGTMGASMWIKDIFVEVDYLEAAGHSHAPDRDAIEAAVQAFANADVENVNHVYGGSVWGIQLHVDTGPLYGAGTIFRVPRNVDTRSGAVGTYGDLRRLCERRVNICEPVPVSTASVGGGDAIAEAGNEHLDFSPAAGSPAADFYDLKNDNFDDYYRRQFFHYAIFGHQVGIDPADVDLTRPRQTCISGRAEVGCPPGNLGGNDLMVTLGGNDRNGNVCWPDAGGAAVGTMEDHLGTFMHELGHNLGMWHGGGDDFNFKPNYFSVMNFLFQFPGIPPNHAPLITGHDYSRIDCPTLEETSLDECVGINCLPVHGQLDWDGDGVIEGSSRCNPPHNADVDADINDDGRLTALNGFEDWNELIVYDFTSACTYQNGNPGIVHNEQDPDQVKQSRQRLYDLLRASLVVTKSASREQVAAGETIKYTIRIANQGPGAAENVQVTDLLPDETKKVIEVGALAAGSEKEVVIEYVVPPDAGGCLLDNKAIVQYDDYSGKAKRVVASATTKLRGKYEYAAKIICGIQPDPKDMRLAQGFYATTINMHNPTGNSFEFCKKLALSIPPGKQEPGKVFPIGADSLKADEALAADCMDIQKRLFPDGFSTPYIEGFVIIQSPKNLDISAVYTTAGLDEKGNVGAHSSVDVERIPVRRVEPTPLQEPPQTKYADLIPVPNAQAGDPYCRLEDGKFVVTIRNQGIGAADPSTVEVIDMGKNESFAMPAPELDAGSSQDIFFQINRSYGAFKIHVDAKGEVTESDEENNIAVANCLG